MQILPFPAAVKVPSFRRFPEVLYDMTVYDTSLKGTKLFYCTNDLLSSALSLSGSSST
jgi:hypothetical protein